MTHAQIAGSLNAEGFVPLKGRCFTETSVRKLLRNLDETQHMTPRSLPGRLLADIEERHQIHPDEPYVRPGYPLGAVLVRGGLYDAQGHSHWWPAQVQQLCRTLRPVLRAQKRGLAALWLVSLAGLAGWSRWLVSPSWSL